MVHSVGGTLIKHLEEHQIQGNRVKEDVLMYYTTIGWMMWNWMVTALALGISQCGNFMIFLSLRFYVKSNLGIVEVQICHFYAFY